MDHSSPPGSSVHWIFQARILEWVAISFSKGSSQPRDQTEAQVWSLGWEGRQTLHCLNHQGSTIYCIWLSNCSSTICWKDGLSPIQLSWHLSWKSIDHAVHGVAKSWTWLSNFTFTFHFHELEKETATHSSVLAWRIPGMGEPGGLPSMQSHRVGHNWSDLAAAAAAAWYHLNCCVL